MLSGSQPARSPQPVLAAIRFSLHAPCLHAGERSTQGFFAAVRPAHNAKHDVVAIADAVPVAQHKSLASLEDLISTIAGATPAKLVVFTDGFQGCVSTRQTTAGAMGGYRSLLGYAHRAECQVEAWEEASMLLRKQRIEHVWLRAGLASDVMGLPVSADQPLMEAGLDSLAAVELRSAISGRFGISLPATIALDYPTVKVCHSHKVWSAGCCAAECEGMHRQALFLCFVMRKSQL